ncbi:hypothetical protein BDV93DRAFT_566366 [Ceratobasidium sp. AG-I]|nr:hypothetical protein BDV93DRAFT_566366 [Ceratobasidium sp. AG-I]
MNSNDHHDARTWEGITDSYSLFETRAERLQSSQPLSQVSGFATGNMHPGVLDQSVDGFESGAGVKDPDSASTPTAAFVSPDALLNAIDFIPPVECAAPSEKSNTSVCPAVISGAGKDCAVTLEKLSQLGEPHHWMTINENENKAASYATQDEAQRIQDVTYQTPHTPIGPSSDDHSNRKNTRSNKLLALTPALADKFTEMEKRFYAEKADWLVRKRILDRPVNHHHPSGRGRSRVWAVIGSKTSLFIDSKDASHWRRIVHRD